MEIRPLTPHDMDQARALWEACFEDHPAFLDWYFARRFQPADGLGIFLDGQLVCDLHLSPRRVKLRQQSYPAAYLIALATAPSFRRQGLARALLGYALRHLAAKGVFFTFLLPFDTGFYTRLGWGEWADHRLFYLPPPPADHRPRPTVATPNPNALWRFHQVEPEQKLLAAIYERFFTGFDGGLERSPQDWTCLLLDHTLYGGKTWLATDPAGTPQGYALVLPPTNGRPILRELTTLEAALENPFLDYLTTELAGTAWSTTIPADSPDAGVTGDQTQPIGVLPENDRPHTQLVPYIPPGTQPVFLGRITRVPSMLAARTYPPLTIEWVLEVTDPLLPENSGQYRIKLTGGKMRVTKTTGQKPTVCCSVGTLARLVTGNIPPTVLVDRGDLTLNHPEFITVLTALYPPAANFVNEYF